ncbi:hypothetical protein ACJMK2_018797 [Sinanodonta woodiana]|uniref:Uncharacterized protein n=1 Tax=Sinanodonta woodiana TaxID=1069815 RepID=A0ABD3UGJ4_SINWO
MKYGCFATPVGHPSSKEEHMEWRSSFSIAERDLAMSFDDTVMKVYILLKMVRKTCIQPVLKDAFSSYHCKVCMLWMRESTPKQLWCTENILCCLILCIIHLYEWAIAGLFKVRDFYNTYPAEDGDVQVRWNATGVKR